MSSRRHIDTPAVHPFALEESTLEGSRLIAVRGELDLFTAPELRERLRRHLDGPAPSHLVVDLSACPFVDASGCHALLTAARRLARHGRRLVVVNPHEGNARVFAVMGLDELFPIVADRAQAAAELAAA